jgi:hypothetical protein
MSPGRAISNRNFLKRSMRPCTADIFPGRCRPDGAQTKMVEGEL